nr:uncharacterized protein LOC126056846 [Helicoverpa armigera]
MARLESANNWIAELPTVLMGLRAAVRTDTGTSAAQLTFGQALRLPGDFISPSPAAKAMDYSFVDHLHDVITRLTPTFRPHSSNRGMFVHGDLKTCSHVLLSDDAVRKPLQQPYKGPYKVIERNEKYFTVQLPGRSSTISIDRLKPAYTLNIDEYNPPAPAPAPPASDVATSRSPSPSTSNDATATRRTRSGRAVKLPVRFARGGVL